MQRFDMHMQYVIRNVLFVKQFRVIYKIEIKIRLEPLYFLTPTLILMPLLLKKYF